MSLLEVTGSKFLYFGFGSNLLAKRILIQNKSAVRKGYGKLKDHRLDFFSHSTRWQGAPATVVPHEGSHVYGAIWEIDLSNLPDLDRQESVAEGIYVPLSLPVETHHGTTVTCRVYRLCNLPGDLPDGDEIPIDRQPSLTYLKTIVKGAIETGVPPEYVEFLKSFKHNGARIEYFEEELELEKLDL